MNRCCCPARAAGRLPGGGQGVRGVLPLYTPHTPRTPRNPGTRKVSFLTNSPPSAARRVGRRREPSRPFGAGDVRACSGAPSALRASGIAFAPAPRCVVGKNEGRPSLGINRGKIRGRGRGRAGMTGKVNGGAMRVRFTASFRRASGGRRPEGKRRRCRKTSSFRIARFGKGGGSLRGEGNPFTRKLKGFPSPLKTFPP